MMVGLRHRNLEKEDIGKGIILGIILFGFWMSFFKNNHDYLKIKKLDHSMGTALSQFEASIPQMQNKM